MPYGLALEDIDQIKKVFAANTKVKRVVLFGSRAMENYTTGSDIDFAIEGNNISLNDIFNLASEIEELGMLYTFDLQNMDNINDPDVIAHIQRVGILFYAMEH